MYHHQPQTLPLSNPTDLCMPLHRGPLHNTPTISPFARKQPHQRLNPWIQTIPTQLRHCARCRASENSTSITRADVTLFPDVDRDLWAVLELASDDELDSLHSTLHRPSLLSPAVKNVVANKEPASVAICGRTALMLRIEQRFRFLAVGGVCSMCLCTVCVQLVHYTHMYRQIQ